MPLATWSPEGHRVSGSSGSKRRVGILASATAPWSAGKENDSYVRVQTHPLLAACGDPRQTQSPRASLPLASLV